jgi:hypothetical protein
VSCSPDSYGEESICQSIYRLKHEGRAITIGAASCMFNVKENYYGTRTFDT